MSSTCRPLLRGEANYSLHRRMLDRARGGGGGEKGSGEKLDPAKALGMAAAATPAPAPGPSLCIYLVTHDTRVIPQYHSVPVPTMYTTRLYCNRHTIPIQLYSVGANHNKSRLQEDP